LLKNVNTLECTQMKKQLNIALLPAAVAAALLSGNVMAGTQSCFETWAETGSNFVAADVDGTGSSAYDLLAVSYNQAECSASQSDLTKLADLKASGATSLINVASGITIASEITNDFDAPGYVDDAADYTGDYTPAADKLIALTYIPTTELPSATRIKMTLSGADFGEENANQLFLLKADPDTGTYIKVASSDGAINNLSEVTFVVGNEPIGAGTRLAISSVATVPSPVHYATKRTGCDLKGDITLTVTEAKNGSDELQGGKGSTVVLASIKPQYGILFGPEGSALELTDGKFALSRTGAQQDDVDAASEDTSRQYFVTAKTQSKAVAYVYDTDPTFKAANAPKFNYSFNTTSPAGNSVKAVIFEKATKVDFDGNGFTDFSDTVIESATVAPYKVAAAGTVGEEPNFTFIIENMADKDGNLDVMNFNYSGEIAGHLTVGVPTLDSCQGTTQTHDIGVNGAVLKVPYMRTVGQDQWIKITNEGNKEASVLLDVFNDKATNEEANGVALGTIAAKETKLFYGSDLLEKAVAAGYGAAGETTHTMTFVVTAPESSVHGVSVQTVPGKGDRVQPVLRADKDVDGARAWSW
jgi:hypothetical protein